MSRLSTSRLSTWILLALIGLPAAAEGPARSGSALESVESVAALAAFRSTIAVQDGSEPSAEETAAALQGLRAAFSQTNSEIRIQALVEFRVADARVVALQARGLDDRDVKVKQAALEALRWTPHVNALRALHRVSKRDKTIRSDKDLAPLLYKAIGQHGDPSSIDVLIKQIYSEPEPSIVRARLLALGKIRDREAIEALIELMRGSKPATVRKYAADMRMSMIQLTGVDRGESIESWRSWWKQERREFEISERPPLMPRDMQRRWDSFWGIERYMSRGERREDRGEDPPQEK